MGKKIGKGQEGKPIDFLEYYGEDKIKEAQSRFINCFETSRDWQQQYREKWLRYYYLYRSYSPFYEDTPDWQSKYFMPKSFEQIETLHPRIMGAFYDVPPLWTGVPSSEEDKDGVRAAEMLLQLRVEQSGMYLTHYDIIKSLLMYGNGIGKVCYMYEPGFEGATMLPIDLFDFFPDQTQSLVKNMRFCIHREVKAMSDIEAMAEAGVYNKEEVKKIEGNGSYNYFSQLDRLRNINISSTETEERDFSREFHEVLEYWGWWIDKETNERFDVKAVIVDRKQMVEFRKNPHCIYYPQGKYEYTTKPFVDFHCTRIPGEFYSIGILEVMESIQNELNDRRNAMNDAIQFALSPTFQYLKGAVKNIDDLSFGPGETIEVLAKDALSPIQKDFSYTQGYQDIDALKGECDDATGAHGPMRGQVPDVRLTATHAVTLVQEGNQRVKGMAQQISLTSLAMQAKLMLAAEKRFTEGKVSIQYKVNGELRDFLDIEPSKLQFDGDFIMNVNSTYGIKQVAAEQRMRLLEILGNIPPEVMGDTRADVGELVKQISYFLEINPDEIFKKVEQQPMQEPQQQAVSPPQLQMLPGGAADAQPAMPESGMPQQDMQQFVAEMKKYAGV